MPEPSRELLEGVLGDVLQDAAFVFGEPAEEPAGWERPVLVASIAFESTQGGALRLAVGPQLASEIAANMLGLEPGDPEAEAQGRAAVGEVLNVIGGAFLTRYFGTQVPSQLGLPVVDALDALPPTRRTCAAALRTEGGEPVLLELDLEERGGAA